MTQVKLINTAISDEYGGEYPEAIVALWAFSETTKTTGICENREGMYDIESDIKAITYKVSYWYTPETKAAGKMSRPLTHEEDGVFTDVFTAEINTPEVDDILDSNVGHVEKILQIIALDADKRLG